MISSLVHKLVAASGYRLLSTRRFDALQSLANYKPSESVLMEHLRKVFERHRIDTVLDVGANDGAYAEFLRKEAGFKGIIHSFEPLPSMVEVLRKKAANDDTWIIHDCALGAQPGSLALREMKGDVFSSFLDPAAGQPSKYSDSNTVVRTHDVRVRTVAEIIAELPPSRIHLKMDTQGFDLEVFAGALTALASIQTLQSELSFKNIYEGAPDWQQATDTFMKAGYRPSMQLPISYDEDLAIIEADGVFVR